MKFLFTLLSCLIFGCVCAENIQNVEYHLPKAAEHWVIANKLEGKKATTIIYIPPIEEKHNAKEFFGVHANRLISENDPALIQLGITKNFPTMNIDFCVLEQDKDSITYEWSAQENGTEQIHGWGRIFLNKNGTVLLGYQTEEISDIPQARSIWLQTLKDAKQIEFCDSLKIVLST